MGRFLRSSRVILIAVASLLTTVATLGQLETVPGQQGDASEEASDLTDFGLSLSQVEEAPEGTSNSAYAELTVGEHEADSEGDIDSPPPEVVPGQYDENLEGTTADAFKIMAEKYAQEVGVSVEEAMRRLELQGLVADLSTELHAHASDVLGGIRIEHEPDFRVILSIVPGGESRVRALIDDSSLHDVATIEVVERTASELEKEQLRLNDQLNQLGVRFSSGIFGQEIRIFVDDANEFMQRVWEAGVRLPDFVVVDETTGIGEFFGGAPGGPNSSEPPTNEIADP